LAKNRNSPQNPLDIKDLAGYQVLDISLIFCYRLLATLVLKTSDAERHRGFESLSLRR